MNTTDHGLEVDKISRATPDSISRGAGHVGFVHTIVIPPLSQFDDSSDFPLWPLDGGETHLSALWAQYAYLVVEFGSFTRPYCGMAAPSMNALAERFASHNVGSIFLYTHEAHPGEYYPHLTSLEQKYKHAAALRDVLGVTRPIMLDALDGACHRAYGSMPNMTWIFNRVGIPIYKSDWSDHHSVANALEYFLDVTERRRARERLAPFRVERLDYRIQDREAFYAGLARDGPKAVEEFRQAFG